MSSTRRKRTPKRTPVAPGVRAGLESLAEGNEATIAAMLDAPDAATAGAVADALEAVMGVNALSAEQLLARFFDADLLSAHAAGRGLSGNGSAAALAARIAASWAAPPRKRAATKKTAPAADWRTPLFYWRGAVEVTDGRLEWAGSWVASAGGLPAAADFAESETTFALASGPVAFGVGDVAGHAWAFVEGSYLLDNGDGPAPYADASHACAAENVDGATVVAAAGNTEFGRFVSLGAVDGGVLTLARRYVADDDARASWDAPRVLGAVAHAEAPWADLPWKLPRGLGD